MQNFNQLQDCERQVSKWQCKFPFFHRLEASLDRYKFFRPVAHVFHTFKKKRYRRRWEKHKHADLNSLKNYERHVYSQFGEDGVIEEIFKRIGIESRLCVEFGIEDGAECNCRLLLEMQGWGGVLIDGSPTFVSEANELYKSFDGVSIKRAFVTVENILQLFRSLNIPEAFDLLSVDIDGNDYWVLGEILREFKPRVIVIEYNAIFEPPTRWEMPYLSNHSWDGSAYFGASLGSLVDLAYSHEYTLVHCNYVGNNAFFVRSSELNEKFSKVSDPLSFHYMAPLYCKGFGHPLAAALASDVQLKEPE